MSTQYNQIISLISGCTEAELKTINSLACDRLRAFHSFRSRQLTNQFNYGDRVQFIHKGCRHEGKVVKINATTVKVDVNGLVWKCSPGLLHKITIPVAPSSPEPKNNDVSFEYVDQQEGDLCSELQLP